LFLGDNSPQSNLFAIDYLKDHPTTTNTEFKKVFDNLEESIKKVRIEVISAVSILLTQYVLVEI